MLPVIRPPTHVSDGDNIQVVFANAVHDTVRETMDGDLTAREAPRSDRTNLRVGANQINCGANRIEQLAAQTRTFALVPPDRCRQFGGSGFAELKRASTTEYVSLDSVLELFPGLELDCPGLNGVDSPFDFDVPGGVRVRGSVEAGQELRGEFGSRVWGKAEGIGQHDLNAFGRAVILRLSVAISKGWAADVRRASWPLRKTNAEAALTKGGAWHARSSSS